MSTEALDPTVFEYLRMSSTATLCTQLFKRGLRNPYLVGIRPLSAEYTKMVGEAFTLRYIPAREDLDVVGAFDDPKHPQRKAIESVGPGQVLVMDCRQDGRAAAGGHILMTRLMKRGAAGMVSDGSVRDSGAIAQLPFATYTAHVSPQLNLALHHAVEQQVPIACAGVAIYPGDIIVGDDEGVVCIPRHLAAEIAKPAAEQDRLESFIQKKVVAGAPLDGTYPPNERTMAEYREWLKTQTEKAGSGPIAFPGSD